MNAHAGDGRAGGLAASSGEASSARPNAEGSLDRGGTTEIKSGEGSRNSQGEGRTRDLPLGARHVAPPVEGLGQVAPSVEGLGQGGEGEEDEEEQEGGDGGGVLLGFAMEPNEPWSLARWRFPSKCGGVPAFLDPVSLPSGRDTLCDFCLQPLTFLLQVYSPRDDAPHAFHRTLFVFCCERQHCFKRQEEEQQTGEGPQHWGELQCAVKAFRCQLARMNPFYSFDPPPANTPGSALTSQATLCAWCATWPAEKRCSKCRAAVYCSREHQVAHWKAGHREACTPCPEDGTVPKVAGASANAMARPARKAQEGLWKEHELVVEEEPEEESPVADAGESTRKGDAKGSPGGESDVQRLMREYKRRTAAEGEYSAAEMEGFDANGGTKGAPSPQELCWLKFEARLGLAPSQVLRCYPKDDMRPLVPVATPKLPEAANLPACQECNSPRQLEFQVLPQVLYYLGGQTEVDSLDFGSLYVYTCKTSCIHEKTAYPREFVWIQLLQNDLTQTSCQR